MKLPAMGLETTKGSGQTAFTLLLRQFYVFIYISKIEEIFDSLYRYFW